MNGLEDEQEMILQIWIDHMVFFHRSLVIWGFPIRETVAAMGFCTIFVMGRNS